MKIQKNKKINGKFNPNMCAITLKVNDIVLQFKDISYLK